MSLARSGAINGFEHTVASLGANPVALMAAVDLSPSQLRNPNAYVSYSKIAHLLELTARACGEPLFGLLLAERQNSTVLGDVSMILSQQPTLGDALTNANQYLYLHARGARLDTVPTGEDLRLELQIDTSSPLGTFQLVQLSVGHLANFVTELLALEECHFPLLLRQPAPAVGESSPSRATFPRVVHDAPLDGIQIPRGWLHRRPRYDEEILRQHFTEQARQLQERYPDNLLDQIRDIIGQLLPTGECRLERVAATLDLHPRVLQKRLKQQGTGYNLLLKETRMTIAEQHLRHRSMAITDLALNLGYADLSIFSRNFRQWTGLSPRRWQARHA